jgi:hypothetical protein
MLRWLLYCVLIVPMVLPTPAVGEFVATLLPTPVLAVQAREPTPAKVCPCTGKPGCNCCGCGDELDDSETDPSASAKDEADHEPDSGQDRSPCFRCQCQPPTGLATAGSYLPSMRPSAVSLCEPRPEPVPELLVILCDISLPIDHPPPKSHS